MKKMIIALILSAFALNIFADIGPVGRSGTTEKSGTVRARSIEKWFINVKNSEGATISNGQVVILDVADDDGMSVELPGTTQGKRPLCIMAKDCADGKVCRCQTYGYNSDVQFDVDNGSAVAGGFDATYSESFDGYIQQKGTRTASDYSLGMFYDASAASGDIEFFIQLR